ncbi:MULTISPECIES: HAD-IA family hydrolase [unclassified Trueperella]|uniref:HAD-IA family hydrolase n=1 Tax=unclassified Trueperella TaxID=2630174 RepID=UPI000A412862|nr:MULTISPECIES: HAD-IA family hydrolase [unclassified Trueperella]
MYTSILWDMGGTLIDTYPAVDHLLARIGYRTDAPSNAQLSEVARLRSISIDHAMNKLHQLYDADLEALHAGYSELKESWKTRPAPLMSGARRVLEAVRDAGGLNLIATHRDRCSAEDLLAAHGIEVDDMVCAPDGYERKPSPDMYLVLIERHRLHPARVLAVGDRPIDVEAATAAGVDGYLLDHQGKQPGTLASLSELIGMIGPQQ